MTYILGLNGYHGDSAACLLRDGKLVAAAEEERFRRIKHWAGFPSDAIRYCLAEAGIGLEAVEHVAINRDPRANLWRKALYSVVHRPDPQLILRRLRNAREWAGVETALAEAFPGSRFRGTVHRVEHHLAHLASAFLVSPFEEAVLVSVDGFGDFSSAAWGVGRGTRIEIEGRVRFPHSLGIFYEAMTHFLGFPHYGDEYKVMGLAPYGEPRYMAEMERIVTLEPDGGFRLTLDYFRHHVENVGYEWRGGAPSTGILFAPALETLLGPARAPDAPLEQRHKDIARSVQAMFERAVFHLYRILHARHGLDAIAISGGCGFNSVANGRLYRETPFKRAYIQSAAGDAGGAIGAAVFTAQRLAGTRGAAREEMDHAYWGPAFGHDALAAALAARASDLTAKRCAVETAASEDALCRQTAAAIAEGQVIGWFQGRMEWGPRALGNRSILCDPRRADMKDILNLKIKRRESFRPFAPSILREEVAAWFETDDDVPFMMQVFQIRPERRAAIPAVTHVDGSGRLQTVHASTNPRYHRLISAFRALTGVPMLLNTSFNENEPVVCRPEEAIDCFLRTEMDVLVLGDFIVTRRR
ncbi:MAG TPA: carbamoyltransferase C-terminal domain-containing protein [Alphaproteobacteria bacterium]|nr:carbamoyltransferase C-terminal domain-containing protein [Alphaproteobacteria bacterium]